MDTQRLAFPSAAVAIRNANALYQQNPRMSVHETKQRPERLRLNKSLDLKSIAATKKLEVHKKTSAVCAVWVFSRLPLSSDVRQQWDTRHTPFFIRSNRGINFSSVTMYPTTNSSTSHPSEMMTKLMGVLVVLPASDFPSDILRLC